MSRLTRDGTLEPLSRDQIRRHERGQKISIFAVQPTTSSRIGNLTRLIVTLAIICDDHACIRPGSHYAVKYQQLNVYFLFYFVPFLVLGEGGVFAFSEYFVPFIVVFLFCMEGTLYVFLPDDVFPPCNHGLDVDIT